MQKLEIEDGSPDYYVLSFIPETEGFYQVIVLLEAYYSIDIGSIYNKKLVKTNDDFVTTGWQLILGSLMLIVIGISAGGTLTFTSVECGILLLYMALLLEESIADIRSLAALALALACVGIWIVNRK